MVWVEPFYNGLNPNGVDIIACLKYSGLLAFFRYKSIKNA